MNFEQRIDNFCIYKYAARLFLLPPRTCLPSDRWTINVKAVGREESGMIGWCERGAEEGAHFCDRVYSASGREREKERFLVRQPEAIRYFAYIHGYIQVPFTWISGKSMN